MARRDWKELQAEFDKLNKEEGINLTEFCALKGISRSSGGRNLKKRKQPNRTGNRGKSKAFIDGIKEQVQTAHKTDLHFLQEKANFFIEKNGLIRAHADFIQAFFASGTVLKAGEMIGVCPNTAYSYINHPNVQRTIEDISEFAFEVNATTPDRLRGRMCAIANTSVQGFFDENGTLIKPHLWGRAQGMAVKEIKVKPTQFGEEITVKMYDAMAAIETLGRVHGLFEPIKGEGEETQELSDEELDALIAEETDKLEKISNHATNATDDESLPRTESGPKGADEES
ncbi:hypothetical protein NVP1259O_42 [Vibrio phage 1.259.O._10N.286.48.F4]|nr:hypothetical protein NVP1259O_42 [Vibrio phage 1.259.O._10N.286.48.F4]